MNCERRAPLCSDGLSLAELEALAREGRSSMERTMFAGYKTYMVAAAVMVLAAMEWMGIAVPGEVWLILNALGLGFLRAAVENK